MLGANSITPACCGLVVVFQPVVQLAESQSKRWRYKLAQTSYFIAKIRNFACVIRVLQFAVKLDYCSRFFADTFAEPVAPQQFVQRMHDKSNLVESEL